MAGLAVGVLLWFIGDDDGRRVQAVVVGVVYAVGIPFAFRFFRHRAAAAVEATRG